RASTSPSLAGASPLRAADPFETGAPCAARAGAGVREARAALADAAGAAANAIEPAGEGARGPPAEASFAADAALATLVGGVVGARCAGSGALAEGVGTLGGEADGAAGAGGGAAWPAWAAGITSLARRRGIAAAASPGLVLAAPAGAGAEEEGESAAFGAIAGLRAVAGGIGGRAAERRGSGAAPLAALAAPPSMAAAVMAR